MLAHYNVTFSNAAGELTLYNAGPTLQSAIQTTIVSVRDAGFDFNTADYTLNVVVTYTS